jgi:hypothetical protein
VLTPLRETVFTPTFLVPTVANPSTISSSDQTDIPPEENSPANGAYPKRLHQPTKLTRRTIIFGTNRYPTRRDFTSQRNSPEETSPADEAHPKNLFVSSHAKAVARLARGLVRSSCEIDPLLKITQGSERADPKT